jgi:3-phosphoglycerate kinase
MNKKTVRDIDLRGKRVLMRVDFNVPLKNGVIQDDIRMRAALPTINYVLDQKPKYLVLMSHLGDPKKDAQKAKDKAEKDGKPFDEAKYIEGKHKMKPVVDHLSELLHRPVKLAPAAIGPDAKAAVDGLKEGEVLMLENTRFHKAETSKDAADRESMAKELASYGDVYVNDAFGTAHRPHASTETVARFLPAVAGFLMEKELDYLGKAIAICGSVGRRKDLRENRCSPKSHGQSGCAPHRGRHDVHVLQSSGNGNRQIVVRRR